MDAALLLACFIFGGLTTYTISERRNRARWRRFERRAADPARTRAVLVQRRAPATIRRTALWSIYMGQMALPGGLLALLGLFVGGLGLISIPGMVLAIRIWRLGYAMLRRDPRAERAALDLQRFAVRLNVVTVAAAVVLCAFEGFGPLSLVLLGYAAVSFAHAAAMGRCAKLLADDRLVRARCDRLSQCPAHSEAHG